MQINSTQSLLLYPEVCLKFHVPGLVAALLRLTEKTAGRLLPRNGMG